MVILTTRSLSYGMRYKQKWLYHLAVFTYNTTWLLTMSVMYPFINRQSLIVDKVEVLFSFNVRQILPNGLNKRGERVHERHLIKNS